MSAFKARFTFGYVFLGIGLGLVTFKRKEPLQKVKCINALSLSSALNIS